MASITLRAAKGAPLTNAELDANFANLNSDKIERVLTVTDNSNPALVINQNGSAAALLVRDEAGDATPFVIDTDGNVAIGKLTPSAGVKLDVVGDIATSTKTISPSVGPSGDQQHSLPSVASDIILLATATQNVSNKTISGGSIDSTPIGASSPSTGAFTTLSGTDVTASGDLAVNGGDFTTSATTFNAVNSVATTVNFAGAATTLTIGAATGTLTLRNPTIVGVSASQALFNTVATTVDFAGAATTLNVGSVSTASKTVNLAGGATISGSTKTLNMATGGAAGSTTNVNIGSSSGGATSLASPSVAYSGEVTTTSTSALQVPVGTTVQQPVGANGKIRYNTTLNRYEGYSTTLGAWGALGGGATGGGADQVFIENSQVVTSNYTITSGKSASSTGPITINNGVTVTIPSGSRWVIL